MYVFKAKGNATYPRRVGETPRPDNWKAGVIGQVDDALAPWYLAHSDVFTLISAGLGADVVGLEDISGLTAVDNCEGIVHQTIFTLVDVAQTITDALAYAGLKLFTFPAGRILVLGATESLSQKTTSVLASTLNASKTMAQALGSAAASNVTLDSTMANIMPSTAFTSSATINVAGDTVGSALAASAQLDGTSTAIPLYLNVSVPTATDIDADATIAWNGSITVSWINLGDY